MHLKKEILRFIEVWSSSQATTYSAAVAYYTLFSIAPLLLVAISVAGLVVSRADVEASVLSQFQIMFGDSGAEFIRALVAAQLPTSTSVVLLCVGFGTILLGASGVFSGLQSGLDSIFSNLPQKVKSGFWSVVFEKIYSIGMVVLFGFVLVVSLVVSALLKAFSSISSTVLPGGAGISMLVEFAVSFVVVSLFLGCLLKVLPSQKLDWRQAVKGGFVAGIFFSIGTHALALYTASSTIASAYGAASTVVLLILWTQYLALAFFASAIVTRLYFIKNLPQKTTRN